MDSNLGVLPGRLAVDDEELQATLECRFVEGELQINNINIFRCSCGEKGLQGFA